MRSRDGSRSRTTWLRTASSAPSRRSAASTSAVRSGRGCTGSSPTARSISCAPSAASPTRSFRSTPDVAPAHAPGDRGLLAAVAELSLERRVVVVLRYGVGMTPKQIAAALDLPVGTVNSRLARALEQLRERTGGRACRVSSSTSWRGCSPKNPEPDTETTKVSCTARCGRSNGRPLRAAAWHGGARLRRRCGAAGDRRRIARGRRRAPRQLGAKKKRPPANTELSLPQGASGVAAIADGRLSVVTKGGYGTHGRPSTCVALSPNALYVAAGIGHSLVAMAPDGRRVWSHTGGHGRRLRLGAGRPRDCLRRPKRPSPPGHYGDRPTGTGDRTRRSTVRCARCDRPGAPTRSLSRTSAEGGKRIVYDLGHERHHMLGTAAPDCTHLAFSPGGRTLLVATPGSAILDGKTLARGEIEAIGWFHGRPALALEQGVTPALVRTFAGTGHPVDSLRVAGRVVGITGGASYRGRRPAFSAAGGRRRHDPPRGGPWVPSRISRSASSAEGIAT